MATRTEQDITQRVQSDRLRPLDMPHIFEEVLARHAEARLP